MIRSTLFLLAASLVRFGTPNVIGIDFGSENMKVGIVSPGSPLEIVTNFQSKRKTPTCISFYKGERMFGSDAFALMPRKPELTFSKLFRMVGRAPEHPHLEELESHYFPFEFYSNETVGVTSLKHEDSSFTPEELLAMMMQHAKEMTKNYGGKTIKDCVLTVPSSFSQHERMALFTAAAIADFNVLSLIEENTAAALNFGMDRNFDEPTTVLFYNMGSSSTQVTIVNFTSLVVKDTSTKNKTISQFEIIGKAWDSHLGGFSFDIALAEVLADRFNEAWIKKASKGGVKVDPKDFEIRKFTRPMTRLRLEALKVKEVLSANAEYPIKIEQLHADVDLITKVTRVEFETYAASLFARTTAPIDEALKMAGITLKDVSAVELIGGGVRVPKIKKLLEEYFSAGDLELGQHLNGDEAMALGAAFRAANLSTAFRVRKIGMQDTTSLGVAVHLTDAPLQPASGGILNSVLNMFSSDSKEEVTVGADASVTEEKWEKRASLFPPKSPVPSKVKTVTFPHDRDIICRLEYEADDVTAKLLPHSDGRLIGMYNISGISQFVKENNDKGVSGTPKIHLSFLLDGSGIVSLSKAEITLELPLKPEASSIVAEPAEVPEESAATDASTESEPTTSADGATESPEKPETVPVKPPPSPKKTKKDSDKPLRRALKVDYNFDATTPSQWSPEMVEIARQRLRELDQIDRQRREREAALNNLEGYMYMVKNKINDNADELNAVSTEEERQAVITQCDEIEEWLYGEGREESVSAYHAKERDVKSKAEAIFRRHSELTERPASVLKVKKQIDGIKKRILTWPQTMPQITSNETEKMVDLIEKVEHWLDEKEAEQSKKTPFEEPAFLSSEVSLQMKPVATLLDRLLKKPKPAPAKVSTNATDSNSTESNSSDSEGEPTTAADEGSSASDDASSPEVDSSADEEEPKTAEEEVKKPKASKKDEKKKSGSGKKKSKK